VNFYDPTGRPKITASRPAPQWAASTWGPYFDAMFPPQDVVNWSAHARAQVQRRPRR
jgi:hypothetical protein